MNICVIGAGVMGRNHIRVLRNLGNSVVAIDLDKNNRHAAIYEVGAMSAFPSLDDVISRTPPFNVEAYVVATPTTTHFEIAKAILRKDPGKPILLEKPVCTTVKEAQELKRLAGETLIAAGHIERHNPIVKYTREQTKGRVKLLNSYRLGYNNRVLDVGVISDLAIHDVDVLTSIADSRVIEVSAQYITNPKTGHECYGKVLLTFANGIVGSCEVSWVHPKKIRKIELVTDDSYVVADYLDQSYKESKMQTGISSLETKEIVLNSMETLKAQHLDFMSAIEEQKKPLVTLDQGIEALRVIEASYKSAQMGRVVKL